MFNESIAVPSAPEPHDDLDPEMPGLLPSEEVEDVKEAGGAWAIHDGEAVLLEDFLGFEEALLAETSDAEALEP